MRALVAPIVAALAPILILVLLLIGPSLGLVRWQPPVLWTSKLGTSCPTALNSVTGISVASTGVYAAGFVGRPGGYCPSPSPGGLFVTRYNFDGRQVWTQQFGNGSDEVGRVAVGAEGVYVAMGFNATGLVRKYSLDGSELWTKQFGGSTAHASISVGTTGVYVGGFGFPYANGTYPATVREYDFSGSVVWTKLLGSQSGNPVVYAGPSGVYVAAWNGLLLAGYDSHVSLSKYYFNGTLVWTRQFDKPPDFICECSPDRLSGDASGIYVAGETLNAFPGQLSSGMLDTFVRKYDLNGNELWTIQLSELPYSRAGFSDISSNPSNMYLALGSWILEYDGNGNRVWSLQLQQSPIAISAGDNAVYIGTPGEFGGTGFASVEELAQSSSLILFGINPPFSFALAALLGGIVVISLLWLRRRGRKRIRPPTRSGNMVQTPATNTRFWTTCTAEPRGGLV